MAKQTIDTGAVPNDGTGDSIRTAFGKANANFDELYDGVDGSLEVAANLADLADAADARDNLDVYSTGEVDAVVAGAGGGGGGATTLDGLTDVDTTTAAPTDGQALIFDDVDDTWKPGDLPSGGAGGDLLASNNLSDVADVEASQQNLGLANVALAQPATFNFSGNGEARFYADVEMTLTQQATSGTGTIAYEKSTTASPATFSGTTSPISLQAGAWLKVTASAVTGLVAVHLKRTA
ncbi:hypothetical protein WJT74_05210 [Sphingomicrobium sp. XHP0239]|uniref:hypothetical protein n=1 Tax=Sphingomicrobium maritimum TaxID=3133972 RepID=UPI0031CC8200